MGLKNKTTRSRSWIPAVADTPMYKKIPSRTGVGTRLRMAYNMTAKPTSVDTVSALTRCSIKHTKSLYNLIYTYSICHLYIIPILGLAHISEEKEEKYDIIQKNVVVE